MPNFCPKCGQDNRPGSRFCAVCGGPLAVQPAAASAGPTAANPPIALGPAVAQAGAVLAPAARQAAAKGWAESKRGMGFLASIVTIGGRAAYSELFGPLPVASGQVAARPSEATVPTPVEPAALIFALALVGCGLVFALPSALQGIVAIGAPLVLLVLAWLGLRRPYFTRMTFTGLVGRLRRADATRQVPIYRFQVMELATGKPLEAVMIGPRQGNPVNLAANVHLWGIPHPSRNELRVWRVETVDAGGLSLGVLSAPRLLPLTVVLFLPALLVLVIWLVTLLV